MNFFSQRNLFVVTTLQSAEKYLVWKIEGKWARQLL